MNLLDQSSSNLPLINLPSSAVERFKVDKIDGGYGVKVSYKDEVTSEENCVVGYKVPSDYSAPLDYILELDELGEIFDNGIMNESEIKRAITACNKIDTNFGIFGQAIDLRTDFANTKPTIMTDSQELNEVIRFWFDNVNKDCQSTLPGVEILIGQFMRQMSLNANVFPFEVWDVVKVGRARYLLPKNVITLDPQAIEITSGQFVGEYTYSYDPAYRSNNISFGESFLSTLQKVFSPKTNKTVRIKNRIVQKLICLEN